MVLFTIFNRNFLFLPFTISSHSKIFIPSMKEPKLKYNKRSVTVWHHAVYDILIQHRLAQVQSAFLRNERNAAKELCIDCHILKHDHFSQSSSTRTLRTNFYHFALSDRWHRKEDLGCNDPMLSAYTVIHKRLRRVDW